MDAKIKQYLVTFIGLKTQTLLVSTEHSLLKINISNADTLGYRLSFVTIQF